MRIYKCDSCEKMIENPYEEKMREFFVGCSFEIFGVAPKNEKRKAKIHLCENCYKGLHLIAEKVRSNEKG